VLRALETFSQTLSRNIDGTTVMMSYAPLTLEDSARFAHRGLLIDTARHYLSVDQIQKMVDSLAMNKMNKLHWHLVDAQSFPFDPPSIEKMDLGAYVSNGK